MVSIRTAKIDQSCAEIQRFQGEQKRLRMDDVAEIVRIQRDYGAEIRAHRERLRAEMKQQVAA